LILINEFMYMIQKKKKRKKGEEEEEEGEIADE
jgi:hypothetical protein